MDRRNLRITTRALRQRGMLVAASVLLSSATALRGGVGVGSEGKIYWTDPQSLTVNRANLDGSNVEELTQIQFDLVSLALDPVIDKMLIHAWPIIKRANLDGTQLEDILDAGGDPSHIALDPSNGMIYWGHRVNVHTVTIRRCRRDGSELEDVVPGLSFVGGIAVDAEGGKLYWTDTGTDRIQRANLDGTNVEDLVSAGLNNPWAIALDVAAGKMYWTDAWNHKIQRANLDGTQVEDLVDSGLQFPFGIALDLRHAKMYWTNTGMDKIQRANLDGTNSEDILTAADGLAAPWGIAILLNAPCTTGDMSSNGVVDPGDIPLFVGALLNGPANEVEACAADSNADGEVNGMDISGFVSTLLGSA